MANNYTQFSFVPFENLTKDEAEWVYNNTDYTYLESNGFPHPFEEEYVGFEVEVGENCWIYAEENGDIEQAVHFCQIFLQKFRPNAHVKFTWANTCSKMRQDEFSGGGVLITASEITWFIPETMIEKCAELYRA